MEIKLSKEGLTKTGVILLLLSGLVFHDFFALKYVKLGVITITYLRVILVVTIPLLLFLYKVRIRKNDVLAYVLLLFMAYGLTRIEGDFKEAFALYCPLVAFFFLYFAIDSKKVLGKCIDFLACMLIVFCFLSIFEIITGKHYVSTHFDIYHEIKHVACGMYYNENDFSAFLSVMIVFMLLSSFKKTTKIFFVVFAFIIVFINQSILCILGLSACALNAYIFRNKTNKLFRFVAAVLLILVLIKPITDLVNSSSMWWRSYMYSYGIKNVFSHMLIGTGIGKYSEGMVEVGFDMDYYGASADPHNIFFELAGTFGIIWVILFIFLLIRLIVWNLKRVSNIDNLFVLGLVIIIPFIGLSSSSCMEKNYIYLALLIPAVYYRLNNCNNEAVIRLKRYIAITKT